MKKALFVIAAMIVALPTLPSTSAWAIPLQGWSNSAAAVRLQPDGSAGIQLMCAGIVIENWHADGKAMTGEETSILPGPNRHPRPVQVTALLEDDGRLDLTIGDGNTEVLDRGIRPMMSCE